MTSKEILTELKSLGSESIKKVLVKHGAREPFYGVKVEELKKIQKKIKKDYNSPWSCLTRVCRMPCT